MKINKWGTELSRTTALAVNAKEEPTNPFNWILLFSFFKAILRSSVASDSPK